MRRRQFLGAAFGVAGSGLGGDVRPGPIIDTHTHFWDPRRPGGVDFPPPRETRLYHPVLPDDFVKLATPLGVTGTVVVEASSRLEDNQWVLDLAARNPAIVGYVGHLVPGRQDFKEHLKKFGQNPLFRGIRINGIAVEPALASRSTLDDLRRLGDAGLALDINTGLDGLVPLSRLADLCPRLPIVINHAAGVSADGQPPSAEWRAALRVAAARPNVHCKVSGLGSQAVGELQFQPAFEALWATFGDDRLIYGSNWPVLPAPQWQLMHRALSHFVDRRGKAARDKLFWRNARTVYKWKNR